jgi:hypothetical protein
VATILRRRALFFCVTAPAESADVVVDVVDSVLSDSASDTGSSSLACFIPAPMDDLLVLVVCLIERRLFLCVLVPACVGEARMNE